MPFDIHLLHEPTKESKSRIKRLRRMETPQYRLRIDEIRAYYDVIGQDVIILAVVHKSFAAEWLAREGTVSDNDTLLQDDEDQEEK